eukprot:m.6373 g.6373  ORF g.6373 m.6373 type:complete len:442 (+) comp3826_c0_seq1:106-1431(+)
MAVPNHGSGCGCLSIDEFPPEVLGIIFGHLNNKTLITVVPAVCRRWREALQSMTCALLDFNSMPPMDFVLKPSSITDEEGAAVVCRILRAVHSVAALKVVGWRASILEKSLRTLGDRLSSLETIELSVFTPDNSQVPVLQTLARHCPQLKRVSVCFSDCCVNDPAVLELSTRCGGLQTIHFSTRQFDLTDNALAAIGKGCPGLVSATFIQCPGVTDVGVAKLAQGCPRLRTLDFSRVENLTDASLESIGRACPELKEVVISRTSVGDVGVTALAMGCPGLVTVVLQACNNVTTDSVCILASRCPKLASIDLFGCDEVGDAALHAIADNLPGITSLRLSVSRRYGAEALTALADKCPRITTLVLGTQALITLTEARPSFVIGLPVLLRLLAGTAVAHGDVDVLERLLDAGANLESLRIHINLPHRPFARCCTWQRTQGGVPW